MPTTDSKGKQKPIKRPDTESSLIPAIRKQLNTPDYSETSVKPLVPNIMLP
uniref:Uncharacterized protein n=1 Tax=Anguilla anguilla TaxID=7936 RepID=A0A0E9SJ37_ANGAN